MKSLIQKVYEVAPKGMQKFHKYVDDIGKEIPYRFLMVEFLKDNSIQPDNQMDDEIIECFKILEKKLS